MKVELELTIKIECDLEYRDGRPAPRCDNPSDPRYSDPGDHSEIDVKSMTIIGQRNEAKLNQEAVDVLSDDFYYEIMDQATKDYEDALSWDMAERSYYNSLEV